MTKPKRSESMRRAALFVLAALAAACVPPRGTPVSARSPRLHITGGNTVGPLRVERVELVFDNGMGEVTVPRGAKLGARAVIRFSGNGPFRAQWEVDGRPLEVVNLLLTFGSTLTLPTAASTVLPTYEPGPHQLALEIVQPARSFAVPTIRYFVTAEKQTK